MLCEGLQHHLRIGANLLVALQLKLLPCGQREQRRGEDRATHPLQAPDHRSGGKHPLPGLRTREAGQTAEHGCEEPEENGHAHHLR